MVDRFLNDWPLPVVGVVLALTFAFLREIGGLTHRRLTPAQEARAVHASETAFIMTSVIGLLSLLIAFTFNLALIRYEARRTMVSAEANAVETAFVRAQLLEDPARTRISNLVRAYAQSRLAYGLAQEQEKARPLLASRIQRRALTRAVFEAVRPEKPQAVGSLLVPAVNEITVRSVEREAALSARIPGRVLLLLLLYATAAATTLGYAMESTRGGHRVATSMLFLLLAFTIATILDLDRPRSGSIVVSQAPMQEALAEMD